MANARVAVLISGRGSNLEALLRVAAEGRLGGEIALVVSDKAEAAGLEHARAHSVPAVVLEPAQRRREEYDVALAALLQERQISIVCLAGFMRRLSPPFVAAFRHRVLNVHPSLLPAFPGLEAQRKALEYGVKRTGATVHFVDEGLDSGPILLQEAVPVEEDDNVETLAARILAVEHRIFPQAVRLLLEGRCRIEGRRVRILEAA